MITVVAGSDFGLVSGAGTLATDFPLNGPIAVFVERSDTFWIADTWNSSVYRVDGSTGFITTVIGDGNASYSGDGGPADAATLSFAHDVVVDAVGNILIADTSANRIRMIDAATGIIRTVVGTGETDRNADLFSGDGGLATEARINYPNGLALDRAGNLYFADRNNLRVRRVDQQTSVVTTVAGSGAEGESGDGGPATEAAFSVVADIALDSQGNIYVADLFNSRVRRVDHTTGIIETVAGVGGEFSGFSGDGGPATAAELSWPSQVHVDTADHLYIADGNNDRIRRVDAASGIIDTVAGGGSVPPEDGVLATDADLRGPAGIFAAHDGSLYITTLTGRRAYRIR